MDDLDRKILALLAKERPDAGEGDRGAGGADQSLPSPAASTSWRRTASSAAIP